ncbi:MAG: hypothetical protein ACRDJC_16055 [Thermomicrobiales bacterium]
MTKRNANIQTFTPTWPDFASLSINQVRFTYDGPTDTLFVDFFGETRPAASVPLDRGDRDYLYMRVDPETDAIVGLQIEHFRSYAIGQHPDLAEALDIAQLVGIDRRVRDRILSSRSGRATGSVPGKLIDALQRLSA